MTAKHMRVFAKIEETENAAQMIERWDAGLPVWTVEMGGLGPAYEQCIVILTIELMRVWHTSTREKYHDLAEPVIAKVSEALGGLSGAQINAARIVASAICADGPAHVIKAALDRDQAIQACRDMPRYPGGAQ